MMHPPPIHAKAVESPQRQPEPSANEPVHFPPSAAPVINHRVVPGCFDIIGRGSFPRITFAADMTL
jgi:hypothetical protein